MIQFRLTDEWALEYIENTEAAQQYDDGTVDIAITGNIPAGWNWKLYLGHENELDLISLTGDSDGLRCTLNAGQLAYHGLYAAQVYATRQNLIKHSTQVLFLIGESMSGDEQWPEVPTTFIQAVEQADAAKAAAGVFAAAAEDSADAAADALGKYPRINASGHWEIWNPVTGQWADTGIAAQGTDGAAAGFGTVSATAETLEPGESATVEATASGPDTAKKLAFAFGIPRGQKGERGQKGDVYFVMFDVNPRTGELVMYYENEYNGPAFGVDAEGRLVVTYRNA